MDEQMDGYIDEGKKLIVFPVAIFDVNFSKL